MSEEFENGTLSPKGRFERMENSLQRIEAKLDAKAEAAEFHVLEGQVQALQVLGSASAQEALRESRELDRRVRSLEMWKAAIPPTVILAAGAILVSIFERVH